VRIPVDQLRDLTIDPGGLPAGRHDKPGMLAGERVHGKLALPVGLQAIRVDETLVREVDTGHAISSADSPAADGLDHRSSALLLPLAAGWQVLQTGLTVDRLVVVPGRIVNVVAR
jgi:hypothetical protein